MTSNKVNPWSVENIDEFLQYCCPECDVKYQAKERFVLHAFEKHPMAKDCLELRLDSENVTVVCKNQNEQSYSLKFEEVVIEDLVVISENENLNQNEIVQSKKCSYSCTLCSEFFPKYIDLQNHLKHKHDLRCDICDLNFDSENHKVQHMSLVHKSGKIIDTFESENDSKNILCDICNKTFSSIINLLSHIKQEHQNHPDLKCEICKITFEKILRKNEHIAIVHEGIKSYVCNQCEEAFGRLSNLKDHISAVHVPNKQTVASNTTNKKG